MKRFCLLSTLIAVAFVLRIQKAYKNIDNALQFDMEVSYAGSDVATKIDVEHISIAISSTTTLSQLASSAATAIRADATARGYSVAAGQVFLPSFAGN